MYVKKTERTMQLVWALGVKRVEVYSGHTQMFPSILCLLLSKNFFFLAACALIGIQAEQWLLKLFLFFFWFVLMFWRYRAASKVLVYLTQAFYLCKDTSFYKTEF